MSWLSTSDVSSIKAPAAEKRTCKKMGATHRVALREGKPTQNPATLQKRTANGAEVYVRVTLKRTTGARPNNGRSEEVCRLPKCCFISPWLLLSPSAPVERQQSVPEPLEKVVVSSARRPRKRKGLRPRRNLRKRNGRFRF